jgi:hypothetical protein
MSDEIHETAVNYLNNPTVILPVKIPYIVDDADIILGKVISIKIEE